MRVPCDSRYTQEKLDGATVLAGNTSSVFPFGLMRVLSE
jgi:hypothetical protein